MTAFVGAPVGPGYPGVMVRLTDAVLFRPTVEFVFRGELARLLGQGWRFRWAPEGEYQGEATGPSGDTYSVRLAWPEGATRGRWSGACAAARRAARAMADQEAENG